MSVDFNAVGTGFVQQYYQFFATAPANLAGVYRPTTLMTWCGEQIMGGEAIMAKFANLTFGTCQVIPAEIDCHPTATGGVLVVVHGELMAQGEAHSLTFDDVFILAQDGGQWAVQNQLFRIVAGGAH